MSLHTEHRWQLFAFAAAGACTAESLTVPIDVIKVRMQLQGQGGATRLYSSSLDAARKIVSKEGISALFKGIKPALLRQSTYGSMRMGFYEPLKKWMAPEGTNLQDPPFHIKAAASLLSGALASGVCNPTDVIKVRMQADGMDAAKGAKPRYSGLTNAFVSIGRTEGLRGLYKGVGPTTTRAAVVASVELTTYDECKQFLLRLGLGDTTVTHLSAGILSGFWTTVASSPFDVAKSRMMAQPVDASGRGLVYSNMFQCMYKTVMDEGFMSLWRGFGPNFFRIGPHCVISFLVIERLRAMFRPASTEEQEQDE